MQATAAVYSRRSLPRIPTQGKSNKSNEMHPIKTLNELNCTSTRTPRPPLTILNRSTRRSSPPTPHSNATRTKTASLPHIGNLSSLYSHSNHSGDLLSGSRSPIALIRSTPSPSISTRLDRQVKRRWPSISLLRSRRKLWKKYWLAVDLPTIPESNENVHEADSVHRLRSRSEKLSSRKPPPPELQLTPVVRPLSKYRPPAVTEKLHPPPPPELDDDTGSESSSSDEDLDAYEFDLSCCSPSYMEHSVDAPAQPTGIYDKPKDSRLPQHPKISVRVSKHLEADISAIYENITRRTVPSIFL
jgi:hypothetical protein